MAKYRWSKYRIHKNITILNYARRSGKTETLINMVLNDPQGLFVAHSMAAARSAVRREPRLRNRVCVDRSLRYDTTGARNLYLDEAGLMDPSVVQAAVMMDNLRAMSFTPPVNTTIREIMEMKSARVLRRTSRGEV